MNQTPSVLVSREAADRAFGAWWETATARLLRIATDVAPKIAGKEPKEARRIFRRFVDDAFEELGLPEMPPTVGELEER